jgi:hypothetical protein
VCGSDLANELVVASNDLDPGSVAKPGKQDRRIDDVGEDDRYRPVTRHRGRQIGLIAAGRLNELLER